MSSKGCLYFFLHSPGSNICLQTANITAYTFPSMVVDGNMSHLWRIAGIALISVTANHDAATDTLFNTKHQHILVITTIAIKLFHKCCTLNVMIQENRNAITLLYRFCYIQITDLMKMARIDDPTLFHIYWSRRSHADSNNFLFPLQQTINEAKCHIYHLRSIFPVPFHPFISNDF